MKLSNCFTTVDNYLQKVEPYLSERVVKYLYSLKGDYKVLVNGKGMWFDDNTHIDEVFSSTLFIPKYMIDTLRVILKNDLHGITMNDELSEMKPIALSTSANKLLRFRGLEIRNQYNSVGLIGVEGKELDLEEVILNQDTFSTWGSVATNQGIYVNTCGAIQNANEYILEHWFSKEELLLLDNATEDVMYTLYRLKTINSFVSIATKEVYEKVLLSSAIFSLNTFKINYLEDGKFKYTLNNNDYTFTVCYNMTTGTLFPYTFTCSEEVNPREKIYAENKLNSILQETPLEVKENARHLQYVLNELQKYVNTLNKKLLKECSLNNVDYKTIINEYPMDLMRGNVNDIICQVLVDFYGKSE